jgi:phage recombination protein Bet
MKAAPAAIKITIPSLEMAEAELIRVLESSIYPGAKLDSIKLVIGYCKANGLDPMQKPVHIVPMNVKDAKTGEYGWRDVLMQGVGLYRTQASRTGEYVGIDEAVFGETKTAKFNDLEVSYPEWCSITVHRQVSDLPRAFSSGKVFWREAYATKGKETTPNAMWQKRPFGQLEKCAEALALRRAFPELGAAPTAEEMEGKTFDHDDTPAAPAIEGPKERPAQTPSAGAPEAGSAAGVATATRDSSIPEGGTNGKPLSATQKSILKNSLTRAGLNELDLTTKFGVGIDGIKAADFNKVSAWITERAS